MASCLGCCFGNTSTDKHRSTDKIDGGSTLSALQPVSSPDHAPVIGQTESSSIVQDQENQDGGSTLPALQPVSSPHHAPVIGQTESSSVVQDKENQDPEYDPLQRVSEKSDVYSYGVVLLELITGRKPQDAHSNIIEWARLRIVSALSGGIYHALVDSKLDSKLASYETKEMERMISCAAASVYKSSKLRPRMKDIIGVLNGTTPPEQIWNSEDNAFLSG
ncbi:hypothetical protein GH714_030681 [Hevea brasiliensis]|uniref:non-specific serine/threonine protein kinase n=1 Tax=Hevea brasiliensis TaxID=3981 RepID=A0A6A6NDF3_HEVBR|nr:hypothetical protein GH714_030681 [Hevea brasiliensis]